MTTIIFVSKVEFLYLFNFIDHYYWSLYNYFMKEKIKIYIPNNVYESIYRDTMLFEILKKDETPNINGFCNMLLCNYFEKYNENTLKISKTIKNILCEDSDANKVKIAQTVERIVDCISKNYIKKTLNNTEHVLSFKPNSNESESIIDYIKSNNLHYQSLSDYLRNFIISYTQLTMDQRESIIFSNSINRINCAISNNNNIFIVLKNGNKMLISPYKIAKSKDELFNYLICAKTSGELISLRISRIYSIQIDHSKYEINDSLMPIIDRACTHGPQYLISSLLEEDINIQLTENGEHLLNRLYLYRPQPISVDKSNRIYTYNCSTEQIKQYFVRFGSDAKILSPTSLKKEMKDYFNNCIKNYSN